MNNDFQRAKLASVRRILATSLGAGTLVAAITFSSLTAANEYYARQELVQQEQLAWNKR